MENAIITALVLSICATGSLLSYKAPYVAFPVSSHGAALDEPSVRAEKAILQLDVPYEPSPHEVVREMIRLANVTHRDVVYDLGCGDGRIVIAAAQLTGARGVGIDVDPARIREAVKNARRASVTGRVSFIQQNLFESAIKEATVVMLFLYPEVNLRLRPKLLSELKPGTRIVSHFHTMGEWKPDKTVHVGRHPIHFWIIPARVSGKWVLNITETEATRSVTLRLEQKFQEISGTIDRPGNKSNTNISGRITGNQLSFMFNDKRQFRFEGKACGSVLSGTLQDDTGRKARCEAFLIREQVAPFYSSVQREEAFGLPG